VKIGSTLAMIRERIGSEGPHRPASLLGTVLQALASYETPVWYLRNARGHRANAMNAVSHLADSQRALDAPDAKLNFRNLLSGAVARRWMEEAAARLSLQMGTPATALAQDGGVAVNDVSALLPDEKWAGLTQEFFLS